MHQSQSSPFPVGSTHALGFEGLDTRSVAIIREWKALRALLADTTQQYLVACTNLGALWTQPQGLLSDRLAIESALTYVDLELSQMISEEEQLRTARIGLTEARNRSFALAPINKLPPEILSHIFITSKNYCLDDIKKHEKSIELLPDVFSGVCTYWRRVALDTPSLWTHIDISPHADTKQHTLSAEMLLQRSQKLPIDLHVIESERLCPSPNNAATLKLASLHLDTDSYSRKLIRRMLTSWVANISPDSAYALSIRRPKASVLFYINEEMKTSTRLGSEDHVEEVLSSLRVLHLHNACFNWNCAAYSGLVDLQIHSSTANLEISTLEVVSVLSSSPGLITLKLGNVLEI
ncbi:hypothetical protein BDV93DRAFT_510583 [Ceratobasidium sp. AG-I]|nr:hypothetical protein BDV93DRAFT_510583 [Ceratobasidium sp. AG-I]